MVRIRSSVFLFSLLGLLLGPSLPALSQSAEAVIDDMEAAYQSQLETVDTYIVETNMYTSYHEKVVQDGDPTYRTATQMKGSQAHSFATTTPSAAYGLQFDRLRQHATYVGTETVNGVRTHVLRVDEPAKVNEEMGDSAESITYFVDAERHVPTRMVMTMHAPQEQSAEGPEPSSVTINLENYQTVDGLTLPHRMEIQVEANLTPEQRQQMEMLKEQMENMPEEQRERMEQMMGEQMGMIQDMMSGEPMVVEVQDVRVNVDIPDGVFSN